MNKHSFIRAILVSADAALLLLRRWFDHRYYKPKTKPVPSYVQKQILYEPDLLGPGLAAAGGGIVFYVLIIWLWQNV